MKKHSRYYYSLLISCLIIMSSCQPKPSSLLKEAMKMENEIRAVTDGVVKEVFIEDNMKVGLNDRIMVIE